MESENYGKRKTQQAINSRNQFYCGILEVRLAAIETVCLAAIDYTSLHHILSDFIHVWSDLMFGLTSFSSEKESNYGLPK